MSVRFNPSIGLSRFYLIGLFCDMWHVPLSYAVCTTDNLLSLLDYRANADRLLYELEDCKARILYFVK